MFPQKKKRIRYKAKTWIEVQQLHGSAKRQNYNTAPLLSAMNILLLNLTRFGDLLQSQAAITDLVRQGHKVAVLCLENFADAAALLSGVSLVAPLPGAAFLAALSSGQPSGNARPDQGWQAALARLAGLREKLEADFSPDAVCNLTPSLSARMLARFLAGDRPCAGFAVDEHGFGVNGSAWAAFLQGASITRGVSPFNVVDMFRKVAVGKNSPDADKRPDPVPGDAGLRPPSEAARQAMRERLQKLTPAGCAGYVALQLGASEERRRWPAAYFAALGDRMWREERLCPVLLGSKAETVLAHRYAHAAGQPFIDLCGETGLVDLASVLCSCRLLVTNDTGTMHYAAGLDVPVLAVFLATAQPFDTGPYRQGSCSVEPDLPCHPCAFGVACRNTAPIPPESGETAEGRDARAEVCRFAITPEHMANLALSRLRQGQWRIPEDLAPSSVRVWLSEYDDEGFMALRSLSGHENEARTLWFLLQRNHIRQYLNRTRETDFIPLPLPEPVRMPPEAGRALMAALGEAADLTALMLQQGQVLTVRPLPLMRDRFLSTWRKVHDCLKKSSYLGALSLLWMQETQAEGQDLPVVLAVAEHFHQLLAAISKEIILENQDTTN